GIRDATVTGVQTCALPISNQKSDDAAALELLSTVLSGGRASRLYRHLVYEKRLALEAGGDYPYFSFDPGLFWFWATAMPGQTPETLEKVLLEEMEQLRQQPVTEEELTRAKNQIEAEFVFQQDSIHRRASLLARFETIGDEWSPAGRRTRPRRSEEHTSELQSR